MIQYNHPKNPPQLGYFLKYRYWKNAIKLLEYQLKTKQSNKHFNTLSMFYYENLGKRAKKIKSKEYFKTRVANNLFYGLEVEYSILPYPIPKSNLGLRKYKFFTYPMRLVLYAVGLYILHLSQDLLREYYYPHHRHIYSEYGGRLSFDPNTGNLNLSYNSIWYKPHYKRFRNQVRNEVAGDVEHKIVIHVDIQNYYDEISIPTLLNFLEESVKPGTKRKMQFDAIAKTEIISFFRFMSNGELGIPQSDNDIISSYIGYLYLIFGDLLLDQELQKDNDEVESYRIIRYMDDLYISVTFHPHINQSEREFYINSLSARIADCLYERLGLRCCTLTMRINRS